jgi:hypothetical protein
MCPGIPFISMSGLGGFILQLRMRELQVCFAVAEACCPYAHQSLSNHAHFWPIKSIATVPWHV